MNLTIGKAKSLQGSFRVPSDKSLTHRAYMFGAIADGESIVRNPLMGEDCEATLRCLSQMGLTHERGGDLVRLRPAAEWIAPEAELYCGNSGTTMRLLSGLVASRPLTATLTGDPSLQRRPMRRIARPLEAMGARFEGDKPPITIIGGDLQAIEYASPVSSAQIKSAILLAALRTKGRTSVMEPSLSRDHTERMLSSLGIPVDVSVGNGGRSISALTGPASPNSFEFSVPGDISSAAFFMVAAALIPDSRLELQAVGLNPTRSGILDVFTQCGITVHTQREWVELGEPVGDIEVNACSELRPFTISGGLVPRLIDEIPVLAVLATQCDGVSLIRDAAELRVKESDRIATIAESLQRMGAKIEQFEDGMAITGPTALKGTTINSGHDHRIAMAFSVAALVADGDTTIEGTETIATSFPGFEPTLKSLLV